MRRKRVTFVLHYCLSLSFDQGRSDLFTVCSELLFLLLFAARPFFGVAGRNATASPHTAEPDSVRGREHGRRSSKLVCKFDGG